MKPVDSAKLPNGPTWTEHRANDGSIWFQAKVGDGAYEDMIVAPHGNGEWEASYDRDLGEFPTREAAEAACLEAARNYVRGFRDNAIKALAELGETPQPEAAERCYCGGLYHRVHYASEIRCSRCNAPQQPKQSEGAPPTKFHPACGKPCRLVYVEAWMHDDGSISVPSAGGWTAHDALPIAEQAFRPSYEPCGAKWSDVSRDSGLTDADWPCVLEKGHESEMHVDRGGGQWDVPMSTERKYGEAQR